jgi:hypothetical protein
VVLERPRAGPTRCDDSYVARRDYAGLLGAEQAFALVGSAIFQQACDRHVTRHHQHSKWNSPPIGAQIGLRGSGWWDLVALGHL